MFNCTFQEIEAQLIPFTKYVQLSPRTNGLGDIMRRIYIVFWYAQEKNFNVFKERRNVSTRVIKFLSTSITVAVAIRHPLTPPNQRTLWQASSKKGT